MSLLSNCQRFMKDWTGASAPEYALMLALVTVGAIGAMRLMGDRSSDVMGGVADVVGIEGVTGPKGAQGPETPVAIGNSEK